MKESKQLSLFNVLQHASAFRCDDKADNQCNAVIITAGGPAASNRCDNNAAHSPGTDAAGGWVNYSTAVAVTSAAA
jgi:hypothetical protein